MYLKQKTVEKPVSCSGVGVHSGKKVNLTIKPAPSNHGIKFIRTDLLDCPGISAHFNMVVDTSMATVIGYDGFIVSTIEHLMASFAGLSIDNALVEIDNYEMPIMDGSAEPFVRVIRNVGSTALDAPRFVMWLHRVVEVRDGDRLAVLLPGPQSRITVSIDFGERVVQSEGGTAGVGDQGHDALAIVAQVPQCCH